tara:strand:+ start:182 stop:751 length:570 start_codon:yes stop_codon:yes gene_type:complete
MKDFIGIYDRVVDPVYCQRFIKFINFLKVSSLAIKENNLSHNREIISANIPHLNSEGYDLSRCDPAATEFLPIVQPCIDQYMDEYSILTNTNFLLFDIKVKKFPIGGAFHDWHYETMDVNSCRRSFVVQLYLNTIEEGGETEFLYINKRVKAKEGRVVIFPAGYTHTHRGNPAIGQDKYLVTSWGLLQD